MERVPCDLVVVEDNQEHAGKFAERMQRKFGYTVRVFRDRDTFRTAAAAGELRAKVNGRKLVVILDVMLTESLRDNEPFAPRHPNPNRLSAAERKYYVDDELGVQILAEIREGTIEGLDYEVPVVMLTARFNEGLKEEAESCERVVWVEKPKRAEQIDCIIQGLVAGS